MRLLEPFATRYWLRAIDGVSVFRDEPAASRLGRLDSGASVAYAVAHSFVLNAQSNVTPPPSREPLPRRGYLGFAVDATQVEGREHWIVSEIHAGSPAAGSALRLGDDLLRLDEVPVESLAQLRARAAAVAPGSVCRLQVQREGQGLEIPIRSSRMPLEQLSRGSVELKQVPWSWRGESHRLRAIWTRPEGPCRAALWLLPSAAWISQEMPLAPDDPGLRLIDFLTARGVATLRVDRPGLGDSEGPRTEGLDFAAEMSAWAAARAHFLVHSNGKRRGLFGRSLGGMLAPLLARDQPFDAVCAWGTSSDDWHRASLESAEHQWRLRGAGPERLEQALREVGRLQHLVFVEGLTPQQARARAPELRDVSPGEYCGDLVHDRTARFFQQLQRQDVAGAWSRVRASVLAVHAEYDVIVPEKATRRLIERAPRGARFASVAGVDHFMHERASLAEAVRRPWGGSFSRAAASLLCDFFLGSAG